MKNLKKIVWITFITTLIGSKIIAQKTTLDDEGNISNKSFTYLENEVRNSKNEPEKAIRYTQKWITKAKTEQNWKQAVNAYKTMMHLNHRKNARIYSDSLLEVAKKTKDNAILGSVYLTIGIMHYDKKEIKTALDFYLLADQYIAQTEDEYEQHKIKYAIAQTKYYLGFYEEAIALLKECLLYFEENNDRGYLNTIHSLGLCYNKLGKYDLTTFYNKLGLKQGHELEDENMEIYFRHSEAVNDYFKKDYAKSIAHLKELLPDFQEMNEAANIVTSYFYMGKSYWAKDEQSKAILYFLKVDQHLTVNKINRPELRENYELLINWYKKQEDLKLELKYINKLIEVDKVLTKNYRYLSHRLYKEYDTKKLMDEKAAIKEAMKNKSRIHYTLLTSLAGALMLLIVKQYRNKKKYDKRFEEVMQNQMTKRKTCNNTIEKLEINPDVVAQVLKNLDKFEKNKKYLDKDMNLIKLATMVNTNTKYASKIIAKYKGKGTIDYITDLKLEYIIELLKTEAKYRNYTNQALGEEAGFGSTQNFTRAFKNRTELSPTYFIQKLKQKETN